MQAGFALERDQVALLLYVASGRLMTRSVFRSTRCGGLGGLSHLMTGRVFGRSVSGGLGGLVHLMTRRLA